MDPYSQARENPVRPFGEDGGEIGARKEESYREISVLITLLIITLLLCTYPLHNLSSASW
jgi:hypothetical protein